VDRRVFIGFNRPLTHPDLNAMKPIVWTIAGSDSGGGAGIQADLKVMHELGVHGCSVITALTAQNTLGVQYSEPVSAKMLTAQMRALANDLPPAAIKTGMLGSAQNCRIIIDFLTTLTADAILICDPVLKSTSGAPLLEPHAIKLLKQELFPHVDLLTPNLPETETLLGRKLAPEAAAIELLQLGVKSVLIKGGHAEEYLCRDYWTDGQSERWFEAPRIPTRATHGTGCVLSSAIASFIAHGHSISAAIELAKKLVTEKLRAAPLLGAGHGPFV
jgi:hydroxymethylpyrimidine kinase/phosphomethylpyrimidine kinase/thiamine-phosphate diphosphorylase